jgi:hypothetical protein
VTTGKREQGKYDAVGTDSLQFSPDGWRLAYAAKTGTRRFAVVDGKEGRPYDGPGIPVFSHGGKDIAHAAVKGSKQLIAFSGQEGKPYDGIGAPREHS